MYNIATYISLPSFRFLCLFHVFSCVLHAVPHFIIFKDGLVELQGFLSQFPLSARHGSIRFHHATSGFIVGGAGD